MWKCENEEELCSTLLNNYQASLRRTLVRFNVLLSKKYF